MTLAHLLGFFLERTRVKEASKRYSFHKLCIYSFSKSLSDEGLHLNLGFSKLSLENSEFPTEILTTNHPQECSLLFQCKS